MFALANIVAVGLGLIAFAVVLNSWNSTSGALVAAGVGGVVAAAVWLVWNRLVGLRPVGKLTGLPKVGSIPADPPRPTPTLTDPGSDAARAYQRAASRLEASTRGRVLLVSGMRPGQGATTAALNLAVAGTYAGRRVVLIDGDVPRGILSSFGRTGTKPGLVELSSGTAELSEAARLWSIGEKSRLPFIPSGVADGNGTRLDGGGLATAMEPVTTAADLVLIDTAAGDDEALAALGEVADGTLLVVPRAANRATIDELEARARRSGAPPVGYLINEAAPSPASIDQHPILRSLKRALATALLVLLAYGVWTGFQIWGSWRGVEREGLDVQRAETLLELPAEGIVDTAITDDVAAAVTAVPSNESDFLSVLIVGSDLSGSLADVIMLAIVPANGDDPVLVSIPRDLYLPNRCTKSYTKINANLAGCGDDVNGPTLLALAVEDFTGIPVDHLALFTFDGFEEIIDEVGGIEICVDYPVRDSKSDLDLPAGCTQATGEQALAWVRSRRTQELVDGRWRTMSGVSDLTRNERQQEVLLDMFSKLRNFNSPADLTRTVRSLTNAFTLDDHFGITDAIGLAWDMREINPATVVTIDIPVQAQTTAAGAAVLVPTAPFNELLDEIYPDLVVSGELGSAPDE